MFKYRVKSTLILDPAYSRYVSQRTKTYVFIKAEKKGLLPTFGQPPLLLRNIMCYNRMLTLLKLHANSTKLS